MSGTADVVVDEDLDENQPAAEVGGSDGSLGMSDEDFLKQAVPVLEPKAEAKKEERAKEADLEGASADAGSPAADDAKKDEVTDKVVDKTTTKTEKVEAEKVVDAEKKSDEVEKPAAVVDYEAAYKQLTAPFKANGKEIKVESVDDAIALMQMGANYNKKMAALKPQMKLLKMLENNDFLSEDKIGWLIDLGKKDPAAINKLVKDSGIDPLDLTAEKASTYKPNTYAVDDKQLDLDTVLEDLRDSPTYARTLDVISNKWDVASKQTVAQNPQLMRVVNDHMASGIYDLISTEVENARMLGRLNGMSDLEAYRYTGDAIQARGGFNHLVGSKPRPVAPAAPVIVTPKPKAVEDDKLKDKRRAAGSTQPAAPTAAAKDYNPLALSDEEFSKLGNPKFM